MVGGGRWKQQVEEQLSDQTIIQASEAPVRLVSRKAVAISKALRAAARRAATSGLRLPAAGRARRSSWFRTGVLISFVAAVILPSLAGVTYFAFIASRQYVSEARFAVRDADSSMSDLLGGLAGLSGLQRLQDTYIVWDYIKSRAMFDELDRTIGLRDRYARPAADFVARLDLSDPIEDMVRYWRWMVDVKIDMNSGIMTLKVKAFTREDALAIADQVVKLSERLVNELSERARRDALKDASEQLERSEQNLKAALAQVRDTRNAEGVLDASRSAEALTKLMSEARSRLLTLQQDYQVTNRTVAATAPHMKILHSRIETLQGQLKELERRIASTDKPTTLSASQEQLDRVALKLRVAEDQYGLAASKYELARLRVQSQQSYLVTFVPPRLADDALYPKRVLLSALILAASLALWGAGVGIAVLARNNMAR